MMKVVLCCLVLLGIWASTEAASLQSVCKNGMPYVNCFADPCMIAQTRGCAGHPGAKCASNYCGGCNAEWQDAFGNKVDCFSHAIPGVTSFVSRYFGVCSQ